MLSHKCFDYYVIAFNLPLYFHSNDKFKSNLKHNCKCNLSVNVIILFSIFYLFYQKYKTSENL